MQCMAVRCAAWEVRHLLSGVTLVGFRVNRHFLSTILRSNGDLFHRVERLVYADQPLMLRSPVLISKDAVGLADDIA